MKTALIVPVHNRLNHLKRFVSRWDQVKQPFASLIIVDDKSTDGTSEFLQFRPDIIRLEGDGECWWTGATNIGVLHALKHNFDNIITVNDDSILSNLWFDNLIKSSIQNKGAVVCSAINFLNSDILWAAGATYVNINEHLYILNLQGIPLKSAKQIYGSNFKIDTSPGNGVLYPAYLFNKWGLFDEKNCPHYHADSLQLYKFKQRGIGVICDLNATLENDISDHVANKNSSFDFLSSVKSTYYLPAIFNTIKMRQGIKAALMAGRYYISKFGNCKVKNVNHNIISSNKNDFISDPNITTGINTLKAIGFSGSLSLHFKKFPKFDIFYYQINNGSNKLSLHYSQQLYAKPNYVVIDENNDLHYVESNLIGQNIASIEVPTRKPFKIIEL